jgi:uncharacterized protein YkwD
MRPLALLAVVGVGVLAVSATVGTGVGALDSRTPTVGDPLEDFTDAIEADVNTTEVERQIHAEINAERRVRGLDPLAYRDGTAARAREHTAWMTQAGELSHSNLRHQYRCTPAGENVAYTYVAQDIVTEDGRAVNHHGNESSIAEGIVNQWLRSPPHRENLLDPRFSGEGIGVAVGEDDEGRRVYATQALCG